MHMDSVARTEKPTIHSFIDLTGDRYGITTVIEYWGRVWTNHHAWLCRCDCGNEHLAGGNHLRTGVTKSCGCLHSGGRAVERHGHHDSRTYSTWEHMIHRCTRPNYYKYHLYGGRGISVCDRWRNSFVAFLEDMGERPEGKTLDRYPNPNGNYEPGNCRWATAKEQARSSRKAYRIEWKGEVRSLSEIAEMEGVNRYSLIYRFKTVGDIDMAVQLAGKAA